jgi:hypothetical protein
MRGRTAAALPGFFERVFPAGRRDRTTALAGRPDRDTTVGHARHQPWRTEKEITEQELAMFKGEPRGSCQSPHLARASQVSSEDTLVKAAGAHTKALYENAELTLEVADAAADAGCPEQARALYREVIRTFTGSGYAAHRQRAEIGLAELRG